ncbi:MAG TPA: D-alanyl-D-alanine carboxypeptidase, partial [Bacillales bacterium]|nr:D-alanyl-D-alanine carboxypeptidase [Bacillales bacterium]
TATARKNGMRVIAVVMGAKSAKSRNKDVTNMLDYAYSQFMTHSIYPKGKTVRTAHVDKGLRHEVPVKTSQKVSVLTKKGESPKKIEKSIYVKPKLKAPLKKGQKIGKLVLKKNGRNLSVTPLVAGEDVQKASWWNMFKHSIGFFVLPSNAH